MFVYKIEVTISNRIKKQLIDWLYQKYINDILSTGCFLDYQMLEAASGPDHTISQVLLYYNSQEDYERYKLNHFSRLFGEIIRWKENNRVADNELGLARSHWFVNEIPLPSLLPIRMGTLRQNPAFAAAETMQDYEMAVKLLGSWRLLACTAAEFLDEENKKLGPETDYWGPNPKGILSYDAQGRMAVQLYKGERAAFASDQWTDQEIKEAYTSYQAYHGAYRIDFKGSMVTHYVDGGLYPHWVGHQEIRYFHIEGNKLTITAPPITLLGKSQEFKLVWEKI